MAAALEERFEDIEIEMIPSSGGRFEVVVDGKLIFSKKAAGRHPTHEEILDAVS